MKLLDLMQIAKIRTRKIGSRTKIWFPHWSNIGACEIGHDCVIHSHVWIANGVKIGNRVKIQAFSFIPKGVTLEDDVFIGPHVCFTNDRVPPHDVYLPTLVKRGAAIGANSTIICGVTIGEDSLVGAGSVVTKNVPTHWRVFGNPAKPSMKSILQTVKEQENKALGAA